jgi:hypothetical protein
MNGVVGRRQSVYPLLEGPPEFFGADVEAEVQDLVLHAPSGIRGTISSITVAQARTNKAPAHVDGSLRSGYNKGQSIGSGQPRISYTGIEKLSSGK